MTVPANKKDKTGKTFSMYGALRDDDFKEKG
jgi:hypothetical protein